ncbi:diguanylate cyclase [Spirulina subsalsa FACHB-351]|uniref:Diguanylate cyclase n=1 Tax=Spirulina subsalsa FACHB-351 TaxID=234711 RepID=A0ABT3L6N4_9CYAN|nr:diguanylate cyclase [Spirulina subsalsa]MCW6037112.1 diguanylate cyclase [Spirulina subsalsa FACHB-351]
MKIWQTSLKFRLVSYFSVLCLVMTLMAGTLTFFGLRKVITENAVEHLERITDLKEDALNLWLENQRQAIAQLSQFPTILTPLTTLNNPLATPGELQSAQEQLQAIFTLSLAGNYALENITIIHPPNQVLFSTLTSHSPQRLDLLDWTDLAESRFDLNSSPSSPLFLTVPLTAAEEPYSLGTLVAHLNPVIFQRIANNPTGLGKTGRIYLLNGQGELIPQLPRETMLHPNHNQGIEGALNHRTGVGWYRNSQSVPVIGVYRWLKESHLGLLVEMEQAELFRPVDQLVWQLVSAELLGSILLLVGVYWLACRITQPILAIAYSASQIADGNLSVKTPPVSDDELGILAQAFNRMTKHLCILYASLNEQIVRLRCTETSLRETCQQLQQEVAERHKAEIALAQANQHLYQLATLDGLTQIANRRQFDETLQQEWKRMARERLPLSLIMIDVDEFKRYNDYYGHLMGDDCLQKIAQGIQQVLKRSGDLVARYGGEEFAVLLPHTDTTGALRLAHLIQEAVRGLQLTHATSPVQSHVTVSLGLATVIPHPEQAATDLIEQADQALFQAKRNGRNCVRSGSALSVIARY